MTVVLIQEYERWLNTFPVAGSCSQCGGAVRYWPVLKQFTHTHESDGLWCRPSPGRHFVEISGF